MKPSYYNILKRRVDILKVINTEVILKTAITLSC